MTAPFDLVCFSHLRWGFVYQRPQHLLTRCARDRRVFYVEEPVEDAAEPWLEVRPADDTGPVVVVPHLPGALNLAARDAEQRRLVDRLFAEQRVDRFVLWFYTPMALPLAEHLRPLAVVYDCMDELSAFSGAPPELTEREDRLYELADLVFTGGETLYESKRSRHPNAYLFPSSVDVEHFGRARRPHPDHPDQRDIPHPRIGFFGVIDERMDLELLRAVADARPEWQLVMVGPVVKIDAASLPQGPNIHYLGKREYDELPDLVAGWDVAMLPFALNASTRFISPTKTPEYLAAGRQVVSTPIADVVKPYGERGVVRIAATPEEFVAAVQAAMRDDDEAWLPKVDAMLGQMSWDRTWRRMAHLIDEVVEAREEGTDPQPTEPFVSAASGNGHGGHNGDGGSRDRVVVLEDLPDASGTFAFDYLVVGAGFAGSVLAERLASVAGKRVLVVDRRRHVGGNAFDRYDDAGILVHRYGPHIFHTNSREVFDHLSLFTEWRQYQHRVLASVDGRLVPIPINLDTLNELYGLNLTAFEAEEFLARVAEPVERVLTSEDAVVSKVGRDLYEKFFRGYTRKQWGMDPSELDAAVAARVPVRTNRDPRYFTDTYQAMPLHGYTRMFERMLDHPNIKVLLNTDHREAMRMARFAEVVYTGRIDEFFDFRLGELPYRSLEFRFETHDTPVYQPAPVVNYPNDYAYTRVTEFKYLTGQEHPKTTIVYEYPRASGDPYYPVPKPENAELYKRYQELAKATPGVHFVGRLGTYKYYNMDQVVAQALAVFHRLTGSRREKEDDALGATVSPVRALGGGRVHQRPAARPALRTARP